MLGIEKLLSQYISDHIGKEDDLLFELRRKTHLKVIQPRMLSGHLQGQFLSVFSQILSPRYILEIGTFTGYSALCLAKGLTSNGELHTIEINDELINFSSDFFKRSPFAKQIIQHVGNAIEIIPTLNFEFDLIFIDGDKRQYTQYYESSFPVLKNGGVIIADNTLWSGKVVQELADNDAYTKGVLAFNKMVAEDSRVEVVILPVRDGISLIRKK